MTKAKKVLSFCLAVVMVIGVFAFSAFAAAETATITVSASQTAVKTGDVIDVTVKLTTDYFVGPTQLPIHYNADVLQFVDDSATGMDLFGANGATSFVHAAKSGCVQFGFTPVTAKGAVAQKLSDATVVTFQLRAIKDGSSEVALHAEDQKSSGNANGQLYVGSFTSSNTDEVANPVGQTLKLTGTTVNVGGGSTEKNKLAVKPTAPSQPTIDTVNKSEAYTASVYGMDTLGWNDDITPEGAISDYLTTTLGDEYLRITTPDSGVETTGTVIEVLDADKQTVLETYIFIYFGDMDQDGAVGASDAGMAEYYEGNYAGIDTLEQLMAGDLDSDGFPGAADAGMMEYYEGNYVGLPLQTDVAATAVSNQYELI